MCKDVLQWGIAWCWRLLALLGWMISSLLLGGLRCIWGQWHCWSCHGAAIPTCSPPFGNSLVRVGGFVRPLRCISMPTCQLRHHLSARNKLPICLPRSWGTAANTKLEIVEAISHARCFPWFREGLETVAYSLNPIDKISTLISMNKMKICFLQGFWRYKPVDFLVLIEATFWYAVCS